jgi:hypothetical protein
MTLIPTLKNLAAFMLFFAPTLTLLMRRSRGVMATGPEELGRMEDIDIDAFERRRRAYNRRARVRLGLAAGSIAAFVAWAMVSSALTHDEYHALAVMFIGVLFGGAWVSLGLPFVLHDLDKLMYVNGHEAYHVYAHGHHDARRGDA